MAASNSFLGMHQHGFITLSILGFIFLWQLIAQMPCMGFHLPRWYSIHIAPSFGQFIPGASACWEHYLCYCTEVASLAMGKQMSFLQEACRVQGISLALYSMSHHVATLVWVILQKVHRQHRSTVRVSESMGTGSCSRSVSTCDDVS